MDWNHKDEWRKPGKDFLVTVTRHTSSPSVIDLDEGPNRWAVYAYIYPKHPLFGTFDGEHIYQQATESLPFHCGCSFVRKHLSADGVVQSYQAGADYHHYGDEHFTHFATKEEAHEVFIDAEMLFNRLMRDN